MKTKSAKNAKDLEHQALIEEYKSWFQLMIAGTAALISNVLTLPQDVKITTTVLSFGLIMISFNKIGEIKEKLKNIRKEISKL